MSSKQKHMLRKSPGGQEYPIAPATSIPITLEDLKNAVSQCELRCEGFDIDDIWDALLKPQKPEEVVAVGESEEFIRMNDYNITLFPRVDDNDLIHVMVRRIDRKPIHSWYELMKIKDNVLGEETEAVELYPARSRLVDEDHIYHLWALPNKKRFPFGMKRLKKNGNARI